MANKTRIEFDGFEDVTARLNRLGGNVKQVTEKALKETHRVVTQKAEKAIAPHKLTGDTEKSLVRQAKIEWGGLVGSVKTGFDISKGGLAHIFLMYGTPRIKKDQNLYNAFFGKQTQKEIKELQEDIFYDEIRRLNG